MKLLRAKPHYIVEKSNQLVRVMLPSKKNIFHILCTLLGLLIWGYMEFAFLSIVVTEIGKKFGHAAPFENTLTAAIILLLMGLLIGVIGIYELIWLLAGKEIIEANLQVLKIWRQTPIGRRAKEYVADQVKNLRVVHPSSLSRFRSFQQQQGSSGMIAFDYGAKTFRFGTAIDEAEAKQIVLALKEGLPQENAG